MPYRFLGRPNTSKPDSRLASSVSRIVSTTSSTGAGANGDCRSLPVRRAFSTVEEVAMPPASRIWVQRKLKNPLRITSVLAPPANWRATASIA